MTGGQFYIEKTHQKSYTYRMKSNSALLIVLSLCAACSTAPQEKEFSHDAVRETIREHASDVKMCYVDYLAVHAKDAGKIIIEWVIDDQGEVLSESVKPVSNTFKNNIVYNCIAEKLVQWKFPATPHGREAVIKYPFLFNYN